MNFRRIHMVSIITVNQPACDQCNESLQFPTHEYTKSTHNKYLQYCYCVRILNQTAAIGHLYSYRLNELWKPIYWLSVKVKYTLRTGISAHLVGLDNSWFMILWFAEFGLLPVLFLRGLFEFVWADVWLLLASETFLRWVYILLLNQREKGYATVSSNSVPDVDLSVIKWVFIGSFWIYW